MAGATVNRENGLLIVRGSEDHNQVLDLVHNFINTEIREGQKCLTQDDIEQAFLEGKKLTWHPKYDFEFWWRDGKQPLEVTSIWKPNSLHPCILVEYKCSITGCIHCKDSNAKWLHHFKIVRPDGLDYIGKGEEVEIRHGKRRETETLLVDEPVFILTEA